MPEALPERAIYRGASPFAYLGSLFVHSWDESVEFWEAKRKGLVIQLASLALGAHVWALIRGWTYAMNEVLLGTLITVGTPVTAALLLYMWGVVKATWQLHRRALSGQPLETPSGVQAEFRDRVLATSAQIKRFVRERIAAAPPDRAFHPMWQVRAVLPPEEAVRIEQEITARARAHASDSMDSYDSRFSESVARIRRELAERGFTDQRLDAYPTHLEAVADIAAALSDAAERLSSVVPNQVAELHQASTRHGNEIATLREEVAARDVLIRQLVKSGARHLHEYQKEAIRRAVEPLNAEWVAAGHGPLAISIFATAAGDCVEYALEFERVLKSAGLRIFEVSGPARFSGLNHDYREGVWLRWSRKREQDKGRPALGDALANVLAFCEIDYTPFENDELLIPDLIVGARRPD